MVLVPLLIFSSDLTEFELSCQNISQQFWQSSSGTGTIGRISVVEIFVP